MRTWPGVQNIEPGLWRIGDPDRVTDRTTDQEEGVDLGGQGEKGLGWLSAFSQRKQVNVGPASLYVSGTS